MLIMSQNSENEGAILDCVQRFFFSYKIGLLLKKCNGTKEKGISSSSLFCYKLSNIFLSQHVHAAMYWFFQIKLPEKYLLPAQERFQNRLVSVYLYVGLPDYQ